MADAAEVAIVGAGLAGTSLAIRLAQRGISSILVDYAAEPKWRACGVFSSPLTRRHLADLGHSASTIRVLTRSISALNLETTRGVRCRIEYERGHACGFDRPRLDAEMLERARSAGVDVRMGTDARQIELPSRRAGAVRLTLGPTVALGIGSTRTIEVQIVVGAGGAGHALANAGAPVVRQRTRIRKSGLTFHRPDADALPEGAAMEGRFVFGNGWYVGIAPVPGARVNVGMVIPPTWLHEPPAQIARRVYARFPQPAAEWMSAPNSDEYRVAGVLNHSPRSISGERWLLVGDATGFIDPLTGEGIHRAFVSSEMAADAISRHLRGDRNALPDYDRRLRARFRSKDVVSWILQGFLAQPRLFDYALTRLARRHGLRKTLTLVLTDQLPATRALDPRFLARLMAP